MKLVQEIYDCHDKTTMMAVNKLREIFEKLPPNIFGVSWSLESVNDLRMYHGIDVEPELLKLILQSFLSVKVSRLANVNIEFALIESPER